ncbi:MAG TPA: MFS transporter [Steroidobacteraceae bacterium]|nr:MFS transporter [Steroidobacteraceae bacterium]
MNARLTAASGRSPLVTLLVICAIVALNSVDRNMLSLVLPVLKQELHLSDTTLGLLAGPAFMLVYAVAGLPMAWLADRWSRSQIILLGLAFWSVVTAATGLATTTLQLATARVALGLGEATTTAPASALIADHFLPRSRAAAFSVLTCGAPLGIMLGFPLVGWVSAQHGWRSAFYLMGAIGLLLAIIMRFTVREAPGRSVAVAAMPAERLKLRDAMLLALRSRAFQLLVLGGTLLSVSYGVMTAWSPTFLLRVHGLASQAAGGYLGLYRGLFGIAASLGGGLLVTLFMRRDGRWLAWLPALLCLLAGPAEVLFLLASDSRAWQAGLGLDTLLVSGATPCTFALLVTVVDERMRALGVALYLLIFHLIGQSFGPPLVGALNEHLAAAVGATAIRYSMLSAPVSMILAGLAFFRLAHHLHR